MVKNLRKGKPGAGAWQRGEGAVAAGRRCGACGAKVWGMAHHCQGPHGHGIATSGVHMEIIMKFSVALTCVKSPVSRTRSEISAVLCAENVLSRTSWKESWLELEMAGVETTKGWKVRRESDGKRVG